MPDHRMQIGEVAERTRLSLRTIRYYEEVGLVPPSARSKGGFRLYTEADVERLLLVRQMKPLDFSLEDMRDLLSVVDELDADVGVVTDGSRQTLVDRLAAYHEAATQRIEALREQLNVAETFAADLRRQIGRRSRLSPSSRRGPKRRERF